MNDAETSAAYAQEIMRLEKELADLHQDASSKWAFLEWRDRAEKAEAELTALREELKNCSAAFDRQQEQLDRHADQLASKQAKIDSLMFEYCPEEMSPEQKAEWTRHQQPVKEELK
jgi:chromosome segregation ATPase